MTYLGQNFAWGTLKSGFASVDGVFRETHPWRTRDGVAFVSGHGAIVTSDHHLPYNKPFKFLAPVESADHKEAGLLREDLILASEAQFAMAELEHGRYSPFDKQTGLFRIFAAVCSESEVISFANRFGPLGADLSTAIVHVEDSWKQGLTLYWAEPIERWLAEAADMARVIALWDLIRAGERNIFATKLTRSTAQLRIKTGSSQCKRIEKNWVLAKKADNPDRFQVVAETEKQDWPRLLLKQWVNHGSRGRNDLGLSGRNLHATMVPKGLIGALWQQVCLSIDGNVDFLKCLECRDWFGISPEHARPEKLYCSDACRMRAYRKRKKKRGEEKDRKKGKA